MARDIFNSDALLLYLQLRLSYHISGAEYDACDGGIRFNYFPSFALLIASGYIN